MYARSAKKPAEIAKQGMPKPDAESPYFGSEEQERDWLGSQKRLTPEQRQRLDGLVRTIGTGPFLALVWEKTNPLPIKNPYKKKESDETELDYGCIFRIENIDAEKGVAELLIVGATKDSPFAIHGAQSAKTEDSWLGHTVLSSLWWNDKQWKNKFIGRIINYTMGDPGYAE